MCAHARLSVSFLRFFVFLRCGVLATNKLLRLLQCLVRGFDLLRPVLCPVQQQQEEQQQEQRDKSPRGVCIRRAVLLRLCGACLCANLPWRWVCFGCSPSAPSSRPRTRSRTSQTCLLRCWACVPNWLGLQKSGEWSVRAPLLLCCSFVLRLLLLSLVLLLLLGAAVPGGACHDDSFMGGGAMVATHMPVARMHES